MLSTTKNNKMNPKLQLLSQMYNDSNGKLKQDLLFKACFIKDLKDAISMLSHKQQVYFALQCSESVKHMINDYEETLIEAQKCLDLVKIWLKNDKAASSTEQKLRNAANAVWSDAWSATYAAASAVDAAWSAAYTAYAADAANNSAKAAYHHHNKSEQAKQKQEQLNLSFLIDAINYKGQQNESQASIAFTNV